MLKPIQPILIQTYQMIDRLVQNKGRIEGVPTGYRELDEIFPWSHLSYGVSEAFLKREWEKAQKAQTTPNCRQQCAGCGANRLLARKEGKCVE